MAAAAAAATPPGPAAGPRRFSLLAIVGGGCHRPGLLAAALQQLERGEPRPRGVVSRPPHGSGPDAGSAALRPPRARGGGRREEILGAGSRWAAPRAAVVPGGCRLPGVGSRPSSMDLPRHLFRTPAFRPPLPPLLMQSVRPPRGRSGSAICPKSPRFAPGFVPAICPAPPPRSHLCPRGPLCAGTDVWWGGVSASQLLHHPRPEVVASQCPTLGTPTCHHGGTKPAVMGNRWRTAPAALCATPHRGSLRHRQPLAGSDGGGSPSPPPPRAP